MGSLESSEEHESIVVLTGEVGVISEGEVVEMREQSYLSSALHWSWLRMMAKELHWSFVFGVVVIYGISQGLGWAVSRVASDYYWKDVQLTQPSGSQVFQGIASIPWVVKPLWGLLTDVLPLAGYRRRPYFVLAGLLGIISMLTVSLQKNMHIFFAVIVMTAASASVAIADVTIDACIAQQSISHPPLAADIQSLSGLSSSIGGILGFAISGLLVHAIGSQGVFGLLSIPSVLVFTVGLLIEDVHKPNFVYKEVCQKFVQANKTIWTTLKSPDVWKPCLYMYTSLALSLNIHEGLFYWYTDPKAGPTFSQGAVGFICAVGSIGSLVGVLLYQTVLKEYPFRDLLFWSQLLSGFAGMLDLMFVLRLNLRLGIPDYLFVVIDESVSKMIGRLKWMPLLVLSSKLCPAGVEGTFFALLMSIDNIGMLTSSWGGGLLLHILRVTRTSYSNLWAAIFIRNIMRLFPLSLIYLVPKTDPKSAILPVELLLETEIKDNPEAELEDTELVSLVDRIQ